MNGHKSHMPKMVTLRNHCVFEYIKQLIFISLVFSMTHCNHINLDIACKHSTAFEILHCLEVNNLLLVFNLHLSNSQCRGNNISKPFFSMNHS